MSLLLSRNGSNTETLSTDALFVMACGVAGAMMVTGMLLSPLWSRSLPQVTLSRDWMQFHGDPPARTRCAFGGRKSVPAYAARGKSVVRSIEYVSSLPVAANDGPRSLSATSIGTWSAAACEAAI